KIDVAQPDGFITFAVPAGKHVVEINFEETWPRRVAWGVSLIALLGLGAAIFVARGHPVEAFDVTPMSWRPALVLGAVVAAGLGLKLIAAQTGGFRYQSTGSQVLVAQYLYYVKFDREIQILGYDISDTTLHPGDPLTATVYWKALAAVPVNYNVYLHLI